MARQRQRSVNNLTELLAYDEEIDRQICGVSLFDERDTRYADQGAHDVSPTFYFVLEELFEHFDLDERSQLLDVGCSTGRVLAHFVRQGYPGHATGVELDPELAAKAASWVGRYDNLSVIQGSAFDVNLDRYTHLYMFNPFTPGALQRFIEQIEAQMSHPLTLIHMSDNGDTWHYVGRTGWTELASGQIQHCRNARGYPFKAYDCPQHYTVWCFEP
jgi:SAM-dependent methyltransferase